MPSGTSPRHKARGVRKYPHMMPNPARDDQTPMQMPDGSFVTAEQIADMKREAAQKACSNIAGMRDEWVRARQQSGVEERWRKANALYHGEDTQDNTFVETLKLGPSNRGNKAATPRSRVVINIVRPKVDQAVARMCEILLPTDDKNWGLKETPVPETVARMLGDLTPTVIPGTSTDTGMTADDEAKSVVKAAKEACEAMSTAIDDTLTECHYNAEQRRGLEDGVRLGTMVMKGPFPSRKTAKVWIPAQAPGEQRLVLSESIVPASKAVDPWSVWFDPSCGNNHQRGAGAWERSMVTRKELRALVGLPGYDSEAIRDVLREEPTRVRVAEGRVTKTMSQSDKSYELWSYIGELDADDMYGCSMGTGDPLEDVASVVILMVNDKCIGAMPSWVPDGSLPYDVWCWRVADDSPYGHGLPMEMESQQRVINSAWRMVMDGARMSISDQIVFRRGITPVDGQMMIGGGQKLWVADPDKIENIGQAFATFSFPSHTQELLGIASAAMQFADHETNMPQLMGGEKGTAPETVGGMVMLYNTANTVPRLRVKRYDDSITSPHLGRHYDWQMMHSPDSKIKGDFEIDARGSTALLEKDIQNQALINIANVTSNPRYSAMLNEKEELKAILRAFKMDPALLMKTDEEIEEAQAAAAQQGQQPADPRIEAANIAAQSKQAELADRKEARSAEQQLAQAMAQIKREEIALQAERYRSQSENDMTTMALDRELATLKAASDEHESAQERASVERLQVLDLTTKREMFNAEAALKVQQGSGI
jgi:hypothetical protein